MATEYTFYGAAELSTDEMLTFMANAVDGTITPNGYVEREGLQVTAYAVAPAEQVSAAKVFGFVHRVTATFRFTNGAPARVTQDNTVRMIRAVLRLFSDYQADGVLLFNGEEVVLQRLGGEAVLNSEWEDFSELDELQQLAAGYGFRAVPQPLL